MQVAPEDYAEYLRIKRSMSAGTAQTDDVLARRLQLQVRARSEHGPNRHLDLADEMGDMLRTLQGDAH